MDQNRNKIKEIAKLSIEIGNNQTKHLKVYNNSIPSKLAYNFCLEYNLDYESLKKLTYAIKNLIEESNKKFIFNKSNENKNKSVNDSPVKINENINDLKKYNFKDITKEIKQPEFNYKINDNNEEIKYTNNTTTNKNKEIKEMKEINKSSYLNQTESSKNKIKN